MEQKKSYTFLEIKQKMAAYCSYQDHCHQEVEQKMRDFLLIPEACNPYPEPVISSSIQLH